MLIQNKALIIPVNISSIVDGSTTTNTGATFGETIELNLGGRGVLELLKNQNDGSGYLILAGLSTSSSRMLKIICRLFRWNGLSGDATTNRIRYPG